MLQIVLRYESRGQGFVLNCVRGFPKKNENHQRISNPNDDTPATVNNFNNADIFTMEDVDNDAPDDDGECDDKEVGNARWFMSHERCHVCRWT